MVEHKTTHTSGILKTVAFFDLFDFPLTEYELNRYRFTDKSELQNSSITKEKGYYFLRNRDEILDIRHRREERAKKLWRKITLLTPLLKIIPFVRGVSVCNNLAYNNPSSQSDIDLFIITASNRLFSARMFITALLHLFGVRRHGHHIAGRFCLSFFVTEDNLDLEPIAIKPIDIYLIYWIKSMRPLFGKRVFNRFYRNNRWVNTYLVDDTPPSLPRIGIIAGSIQFILELIYTILLGPLWEVLLRRWQLTRAAAKKKQLADTSGTIISRTMLKFHNIDRRTEIYEKWDKSVAKHT